MPTENDRHRLLNNITLLAPRVWKDQPKSVAVGLFEVSLAGLRNTHPRGHR